MIIFFLTRLVFPLYDDKKMKKFIKITSLMNMRNFFDSIFFYFFVE